VVTLVGPGPDLAIFKSHTGNFQAGQIGTYKITVENDGQASTTGQITVVDTLPNGLLYYSTAGQGWTCSAVGQTVTCTRNAALVVGAISEITLNVFVTDKAYPSVTNRATVSTPGDDVIPATLSSGGSRVLGKADASSVSGSGANNVALDPTIVENGVGIYGAPYPASAAVSDQKAGSILVFPVYTSDATGGTTQNTRIALTNSDPERSVAVPPFAKLTGVAILPVPEAALQDEPAEAVHVQLTLVSELENVSATVAPVTAPGPLLVTVMA
jgi:uncharacterized repeat protein (TIGR01451 family)